MIQIDWENGWRVITLDENSLSIHKEKGTTLFSVNVHLKQHASQEKNWEMY